MNPSPLGKILGATVFLLLSLLAIEILLLDFKSSDELPSRPDNPDFEVDMTAMKKLPPLEEYQETINRSLFNWDRKPRILEAGQSQDGDLASRWELTGVVNIGNDAYAIFSSIEGTEQLRLQRGMYLEQWRIDEIPSDRVQLSHKGESMIFWLKETTRENSPDSRSGQNKSSNEKRSQDQNEKKQ